MLIVQLDYYTQISRLPQLRFHEKKNNGTILTLEMFEKIEEGQPVLYIMNVDTTFSDHKVYYSNYRLPDGCQWETKNEI